MQALHFGPPVPTIVEKRAVIGFHSAADGGTIWREPVPILVVTASPQDDTGGAPPDALVTKPSLLPTLLGAPRLLLRGVLPAPPRLPEAPPA